MNITFVSNFQKTYLFNGLAKGLRDKGYEVFWLCFDYKLHDYLLSEGYSEKNILLFNRHINLEGSSIGEYKLHELLYNDRALSYDRQFGFKFLSSIQKPFYDFVKVNSIRFIFGEMTYAHEILFNRICKDKFNGICDYLHPQSIRIPNGRFTFMDTEFQDSIYGGCKDASTEDISEYEIPIKAIQPQRVADVAKEVKGAISIKGKLNRLKRLITEENIVKDSPCLVINKRKRYKNAINDEKNKLLFKRWATVQLEDLKDKKFFFMTLHMQPEASVDVVGRYYDNQLQLIKNVWRIMPSDYYLVIKEHTNAIGNRSYSFFKECTSLRHILFINENVHSHSIIKNAEAIFTSSGTVGLEAALLDKPAFVFSRIFYDKLKGIYNLTIEDFKLCNNYFELLRKKQDESSKKMNTTVYSNYIISNSFKGVVDPPYNSALFYDPQNMHLLIASFDKFLKWQK